MVHIGIDLSEANIKTALVDENSCIVAQVNHRTTHPFSPDFFFEKLVESVADLLAETGALRGEIAGMGIAAPGIVDNITGFIHHSSTLNITQFPIRNYIREKTGFSPVLCSVPNAFALGEYVAGCAKNAQSIVTILLEKDIRSGLVLNGQIIPGYNGVYSQAGHMVIDTSGPLCTCGRQGCLETYLSPAGLARMVKGAISAYPTSKLAELTKTYSNDNIRIPFLAASNNDDAGKAVIKEYIHYLANGIANIITLLQPEVVALWGDVCIEGEALLTPLQDYIKDTIFASNPFFGTRIELCQLGIKAGVIGAAMFSR